MTQAQLDAVAAAISAFLTAQLDELEAKVAALQKVEAARMAQLAYLARCNAARHFNGKLR